MIPSRSRGVRKLLGSLPSQVSGLTTGATAATTQVLSWNSAQYATSYLIQNSTDSGTSWQDTTTVSTTSATLTGLSPSTQYAFRVIAKNSVGSAPASSSVTATTAALAAPLDDIGVSAYRAIGLRKLRNTYAGSAILVRRSSDGTTSAIGFDANGNLNTSTLSAFVGSGSGYIQTWYDQSGNGYNWMQTNGGYQSRIMNAGVIDTINGKPAAVLLGGHYHDTTNVGLYNNGSATVFAVKASSKSSQSPTIFAEAGSTNTNGSYFIGGAHVYNGYLDLSLNDSTNTNRVNAYSQAIVGDGVLVQSTAVDTGTLATMRLNGVAGNSTSYTRSTFTPYDSVLGAWASGGAGSVTGNLTELLCFAGALSTTQINNGEANQKAYYATA